MKTRSLLFIGIILVTGFCGLLGISLYSNYKLQGFQDTQKQANNLINIWNKSENITKELLITYNLVEMRNKWNITTQNFDEVFQEFINSPITQGIIEKDADFRIDVDMTKMLWDVIRKRMIEADRQLNNYFEPTEEKLPLGNLLVTFGEKRAHKIYPEKLLNLIEDLRWCSSLSDVTFTKSLKDVSEQVSANIKEQTDQLRFNAFLMSFIVLAIAGVFVTIRMFELSKSKEKTLNHSRELSHEIDYRKQAENMLRLERDKLQTVLNALGDGMYIVNQNFIVEYQNQVLTDRYEDCIGKKCYERYLEDIEPCSFCLVKKVLETKKMQQTEAMLRPNEIYESTFSPFYDVNGELKVIVLERNITEKKLLEVEAMRAGHLASIGELAAGVAHEINNPINGIINYAERLEGVCQTLEKTESEIPYKIIKEGERIAKIVKNLLSFAWNRKGERKSVAVIDILEDTLELYGKQLVKSGINIQINLQADMPKIIARSEEIQQVFLNILSNARYALNKKFNKTDDDKLLDIKGEEFVADGKKYIRMIFFDKGIGIPEDLMEKIENPFFSTKPRGEGTGLGLSISHGIIKSHNGKISFKSVPNEFTRVIIDLPVSQNSDKKDTTDYE